MKIFIQGFKSIRDGQFVALGKRLTFLVGPNSAGKSVVHLALDRLSGETPDFEIDETNIFKNPNQSDQRAEIHSLGLEWKLKNISNSYITSYCSSRVLREIDTLSFSGSESLGNFYKSNKLSSHDDLADQEPDSAGLKKVSSFYVNKKNQLIVARWKKFPVWTGPFGTDVFGEFGHLRNFKKYAEQSEDYIFGLTDVSESLRAKFIEISNWMFSLENYKELSENKDAEFSQIGDGFFEWDSFVVRDLIKPFHGNIRKKGRERQILLNIFERYNAIVHRQKNSIIKKFNEAYPGKSLVPVLISANRGIPGAKDLMCSIDGVSSFEYSSPSISNPYHDLMGSAIAFEWGAPVEQDHWLSQHKTPRKDLFLNVNKALSENLFLDNGYQLHIKSKMLVSKSDWDLRSNDAIDEDEFSPSFDCQLSLRDTHGRDLTFNEVGSGIGYVMPVLIESFRFSNKNKVVFLQQPELHLHPALQANLTDVLIEASVDKRIVAETHSEHMILRALKRVRQTKNKTLKDPSLKLSADDIAVNYFEPMPDGSTKIHILRVSEDGDFLDRWPNGFFAERDQELFDE